jgi:hypothetical protein
VTYRPIALALALIFAACKESPAPAGKAAAGPQVRATVVTVRTTAEPEKRAYLHAIVVAGDRVRVTNEHDQWRLFDVKQNTVTFVDDVARTVRTDSVQSLARLRRAANAKTLPAHYPRVDLKPTGERRIIQGVSAEQNVLEAGAWRRELWMAEHPALPPGLFAMMVASEPLTTPLAPMMRQADDALLASRGFPLLDTSVIAFGDQKMKIERTVTKVEEKDVAEALVTLPNGYRDLTPKPPASTKR